VIKCKFAIVSKHAVFTCSKNVGGTNAKQAVDVVMGLGTAYQRALSDPIQTESVQQFLFQLNSVSLLLNLQVCSREHCVHRLLQS